ncbi:bifunctional 2',3'-cyclic-nucleotide 2'-phosphodiesterase/3'-nucleotidase [Pararhodobacter zhoushanensis]|uniref:Bifunctional 2',3'-cyclic-nucleotide 2'-phosphodiesterase/3'-nucleotidase n=1 Tax=Pararhodobacter zhoushanensis TaxID=2479545 RepID=A0ABT3H527_9RHOB|nr:bifunctional 2',3'-cyclic-nucleotide 2'-phosphodiesterase/3'-nucleotidase [Pararhodobacter zhoushanensis]MCW1934863.1 bifunctional 2',3'-cyclic-nucleotide 2'-phosphodiesterase/3'-nucleotidase [Pararhodobacter zhoushanensis]
MTRLSRRAFLASSTAATSLVLLHPFSARAAAGQAHLRILTTTDLHCHAQAYDYYADRPVDTLGLARTASIIEEIRAEATNTLMVDNGDYFQGNPMGDWMAYEHGMNDGDIHPIIAAMNTLGYDCGTLGNHEFNYGVAFMDRVNAGANFPVVSANFASSLGETPLDDALHLPPYVILDKMLTDGDGTEMPIKIGIIGFLPPQILQWDRSHLEGQYNVRGIVEAATAWVPQMKAEGADIIVALSHSGIATGYEPMMENASLYLAEVEGIDAIVTGHQHLVFPGSNHEGDGIDAEAGTLMGKPAVMAGFWGSHLGLIDLMLVRDGDSWRVDSAQSSTRPISQRNEDRSISALVGDYAPVVDATADAHASTLEYVRAEVGQTSVPLYSYFALVADDPSVQVVSDAQTWYVTEILKGTEHEGLPVLSAAAPFKAGGRGGAEYYTDVPVGPVAIKNVADLYLYPNTLMAVRITGAQVREWLERSAGMFNQIEPGVADQVLLNPAFPSYNFDVIDGVTYQIDLSQPSRYDNDGAVVAPDAHRIVNLQFNGAPIDDAAEFIVASNNYRAGGGGHFPGADGSTIIFRAPDTNRDIIVRYIIDNGTIAPAADGNWGFAPVEGATVLFETGPAAATYVDEIRARGVQMEAAGDGENGFALYRITL